MVDFYSGYEAFGLHTIGTDSPDFNTPGFMATATRRLMSALREEAEIVRRYFESTVATWNTPVDFKVDVDRKGDTFYITISTESNIYRFVNDGTDIRYAVMTENFIPKTYPNVIGSSPGRGGKAYIPRDWKTRNIPGVYPKPGIKARNFVDTIADKREQFFYMHMNNVFDNTVSEFWDKAFSE